MYKAVQVGDKRKAKSLMKLIVKSTAARLLAIRQVTQLNAGKKTAGIDGKASLSFEERFALSEELQGATSAPERLMANGFSCFTLGQKLLKQLAY